MSGKFVSESKFMSDPAAFIPHILKPNREALEKLITKPEVERKLLLRLQKKAATYAQDFGPEGETAYSPNNHAFASNAAVVGAGNAVNGGYTNLNGSVGKASMGSKIDVDPVVDLYESYIIPLTKEVEVRAAVITARHWIDLLFSRSTTFSTVWMV